MEITLKHSLTYTTERDVPVSIVAKSLLANERLIQESVRLLGDFSDELEIHKINVRVSQLSNESPLKEMLSIGVFFAFQENLEEEVPELINLLTGVNVPDNADTLVTVLVILTSVYVIDATLERFFPGKSASALEAQCKDLINELSVMLKLQPSEVEEALKKRFTQGKSKSLFNKARDFFIPAMSEPKAEIVAGNRRIERKVISEIPTEIDFAQEETKNTYDLHSVDIEIHRADIDYVNQGWVAIIEEVTDRRIKMVLAPEIEPATVYGKKNIIGDIVVVEEKQLDGDYIVKEYHLSKIIG
jgi:hypothetical protein